jgi:hypothetical protein
MSTQVQFKRGTTTDHSSFTGANGELTINTTKKALVIHDGSTQGGIEHLRADLNNLSSSAIIPGSQVDAIDCGTY